MISIAMYNNKGGVGKTTSVINVSQQLALKGKTVLVVDLDGQANSSRFFTDSPKPGLAQALVKNMVAPEIAKCSTRYPNIDIITATSELNTIIPEFGALDEEIQRKRVEKIFSFSEKPWYGGRKYDYMLIDMPPALNALILTRKPTSEITHKEVKEIQKQTAPKPQKSTNEIPDETDDESDTDEPEYIRPDDSEAAPSPAPSVPVLEKKPEFTSEKKNESKSASPDLKKITDTLELTAVEIAALHQYIDDLYNNLDCDDENEDTILGISIKIDCFLTKHGIET